MVFLTFVFLKFGGMGAFFGKALSKLAPPPEAAAPPVVAGRSVLDARLINQRKLISNVSLQRQAGGRAKTPHHGVRGIARPREPRKRMFQDMFYKSTQKQNLASNWFSSDSAAPSSEMGQESNAHTKSTQSFKNTPQWGALGEHLAVKMKPAERLLGLGGLRNAAF